MKIYQRWRVVSALLAALLLAGCSSKASQTVPPPPTRTPLGELTPPSMPTATAVGLESEDGIYRNPDLGLTFEYPKDWDLGLKPADNVLAFLSAPSKGVFVQIAQAPFEGNATMTETMPLIVAAVLSSFDNPTISEDGLTTLANGYEAWRTTVAIDQGAVTMTLQIVSVIQNTSMFMFITFGPQEGFVYHEKAIDGIVASVKLESPQVFGVSRDETLVLLGSESDNPRNYDPAQGAGDGLVFSGLVTFDRDLKVVPDLAESWDVSADGTVYTFHLRPNARFHDGRPVGADDVVYSWERAADPATDSDAVLTYLGDIVGVNEMHAGTADQISGITALDAHTLQVTIDAPKPYFLMKLTYGTSFILDRANIASGPDWYRTPNGTGPYRLIRWESDKAMLYERNDDYYLEPPSIRFVLYQLYAGTGMRLYETGAIDLTSVSLGSLERVKDTTDPLNAELLEGIRMCTSYVVFDVNQAPFDDPKVRQAFALAFDRDRYLDVVTQGFGIPAHGLFPPGLPGYSTELKGQEYDPERAKQLLAESRYGGAAGLPPIRFTSSGFGSNVDPSIAAMANMWQTTLGVTIEVENLEPNTASDKIHDGYHGQLLSYGWCADYPDPENFADALFHSGAQENVGHYANPEVDALLDAARIEPDVATRMDMYHQVEQSLVDDAASIFISHSRSFLLVKPYLKGYRQLPIGVDQIPYLTLER